MTNVIFLLANPLVNGQKSQKFSRLRRVRWSLIIMRNPESEIQMYRLLAFRKSSQMPMYRLLRGGVYYQLAGREKDYDIVLCSTSRSSSLTDV